MRDIAQNIRAMVAVLFITESYVSSLITNLDAARARRRRKIYTRASILQQME